MAKGQLRRNKEAKKAKADKSQPKATISAYKQSQSKGGQSDDALREEDLIRQEDLPARLEW